MSPLLKPSLFEKMDTYKDYQNLIIKDINSKAKNYCFGK